MTETTRTTDGLRSTLWDMIVGVQTGKIERESAKVIAKLADTILKSAVVDIEYKRLLIDVRRNEGPQAVADLNLNLVLVAPKVKQAALTNSGGKLPDSGKNP